MAIDRKQRYTCVKPDSDLCHQEAVTESFVSEWARDDQSIRSRDRVSGKRLLPGQSIQFKSDFCLKPHSLLIDKIDDSDRSVADKSGKASKVVKYLLGRRVQNSEPGKALETDYFAFH